MKKAKLIAVEYCLPKGELTNEQLAAQFPEWPAEKIKEKLGVTCRHIAADGELSSDLATRAAQKLINSGVVSIGDVDYLIFCTQSPDYFLPTTACLIQDRLGIPKSCGALDFNLGCSGWVYGLGLAKGLIESGQAANVLFLTGETYSKFLSDSDKGTRTLFGDAGTATLVSAVESDDELIGPFVYGTDGSGAEHLIVTHGGLRHPCSPKTPETGLCMNGGEIFSFSVREVSKSVSSLFEKSDKTIESVDLFIFHQANAYMLDFLKKKCGIPESKFYTWFETVGNTVSNSIPIALHHAIADGKARPGMIIMFVGFGVGLSWAACLARL
ncbi:MAG: ketoacyl-ACP synthase III [Verrucomicrobiota bacterium]